MSHTYNYDGLYRLKSATGSYAGADSKSAEYSLEMAYDNLHNIVSKKQHVTQQGIQFDGILKAGYDLAYTYDSQKPHQIADIDDVSYRTESDTITNDVIKRNQKYQYDANGNLVYINTGREKQDGQAEDKAQERKLLWDEENRLGAIYTNGFIAGYWYDASGERVVKTSGDDEGIYVNDVFSGGRTQTANFTAYINPYLVVSKGGQYTKHIYIGSQRIVSKLGDLDSYGQDPRRIEYAGVGIGGVTIDYKGKYQKSQQTIKDRYEHFEVPYYGTDNDDYVNGGGFCCDDIPRTKSFDPSKNDNPEIYQYYYHSDHLGSSSLITNLDGEIVQHIEYVPFGEVFIEERNNTWNTPYLFNAKELDEETGLYYYGARYYDPRISLWLSTDPMQEYYPNVTPYHYCSHNPINLVDPDGRDDYYKQNGVFLGSDNAETQYVHIVRNDVKTSEGGTIIMDSDITTTLMDENGNHLEASTFKYLASTLYGEGASTREEAAAIMSVLKNRASEDGTTIVEQCDPAYPKGVRGARDSERAKYSMKTASKKMIQAANGGVIDAYTTDTDYSNGGFWWDGRDFDSKAKGNTSGNLARYKPGYRFTNSSHDLWNQGDNKKSGVGKMNRTYDYKYESTNAIGRTTFSRLTQEYKNSLFINSDGSIRQSNWSGNKPKNN